MTDMAVVALDDVTIERGGRPVVTGVSCAVGRGQVVGLVGPSGCGKTTLMRAIVGVQARVAGSIEVLGQPAGVASRHGRVGYVAQDPAVYGDLTVAENLSYFAHLLDAGPARVPQVMRSVDLADMADALVDELSGGQRARVSLAVALLDEPPLLVLDEPTVGLDPVLRRELWHTFAELASDGTSLLVSSHVMDEASRCDALLLMRSGRLLASGTPHELMTRTGTDDVESAFLALVESEGTA